MSSSVWHADGVASAVAQVRSHSSLLVVLTTHVDSDDILANTSSAALERFTFTSKDVKAALKRYRAVCLRLRGSKDDPDFLNFTALFPVKHTPCVHVVAPDGRILFSRAYFISARDLVTVLDYAAIARDSPNAQPAPSQLGPELHAPRPLPQETLDILRIDAEKRATATADAEKKKSTPAPAEESKVETASTDASSPDAATVERELPSARTAMQLGERARLQIRLPDGGNATRSFSANVALREVAAWAAEAAGISDPDSVQLTVTFPRRVFDAADLSKTLRELALVPNATLIVSMSTSSRTGGGVIASVSAGGAILRGVAGAAGSFLGSFVGGGPQPPPQSEGEPDSRESERGNQRT